MWTLFPELDPGRAELWSVPETVSGTGGLLSRHGGQLVALACTVPPQLLPRSWPRRGDWLQCRTDWTQRNQTTFAGCAPAKVAGPPAGGAASQRCAHNWVSSAATAHCRAAPACVSCQVSQARCEAVGSVPRAGTGR